MPKITIIGGDSNTWGPTFIRDIFIFVEIISIAKQRRVLCLN